MTWLRILKNMKIFFANYLNEKQLFNQAFCRLMGDRVIAQVSRKRRHSKSTADVQEVTGKMASSNSTTTSSISYEKFVIVAEDEWKFQNSLCDRCGNNNSSAFSVHFGGFEW